MSDLGPDVVFEIKRKERQHLDIRITVLDQRAQLEDFREERARVKAVMKEISTRVVPDLTEGADEADRLRAEKAELEREREVLTLDLRLTELDGIEARYRENITASAEALTLLEEEIAAMKEARGG